MPDQTSIHIDEELLERYSMGTAMEPSQLEALEEHLLLCPRCQVRLEKLDHFVQATRSAAQAALTKEASAPAKPAWAAYGPRAALLAVAASIAFFIWAPRDPVSSQEPLSVPMLSARDAIRVSVPAGRPLKFQLDLTGLEALKPALYEVVSQEGELVHRQELSRNEANPALRGGRYWIRVKASTGGAVLREFGLQVR